MTGSTSLDADVLVVGGGIVGVSAAMQLSQRRPDLSVILLEKEDRLAAHQTGHNSGVVHAGVYYSPGSLKADFCRKGAAATYAFCEAHGLPTERCGKLIVATDDVEVARLKDLWTRCEMNGLAPQYYDGKDLRLLEPRIVGKAAIRVAASGIADFPAVTRKMAEVAAAAGVEFRLGHRVVGMREEANQVTVETSKGTVRGRHSIICGGLMADRLARMCDLELDFRIVPFRGEYFRLPETMNDIVSHLIYPVPDPSLPFLGVHLTRMIGGYVTVGPNAVLALAREGYRKQDVNVGDFADMALFGGFWRMLLANARSGASEFRNSAWTRGYLELCRKYCPELTLTDLQPHPAGVRAQAVMRDGSLVHDFLIKRSQRSIHVCNAPSPAATSAIPIGAFLVEQFCELSSA